jgi:micrococcal nuclease
MSPRTVFIVLAAAIALLLAGRDRGGTASSLGSRGTAAVERVVDGDTVVLSGIGKARLIGIDTPEVYGGVQCYGPAASAYAKRMLPSGTRVSYRAGVEPRDRYGRALVYLWLADGRFFNGLLAREGYARPLAIAPNVEYAPRFRALARAAQDDRRGLWRACSLH